MKKHNRGFMLVETLVVSTFIISVLVYLYVQFVNLKKNYDISFRYDTIPGLYSAKEIDKFINNNYGYTSFVDELDEDELNEDEENKYYIEIYNDNECNYSYFSKNIDYCNKLMSSINAKTVILTKIDLTDLNTSFKNKNPYSNSLYLYIKSINYKIKADNYLLIIEYNDNTFSNIKIEKSEEE